MTIVIELSVAKRPEEPKESSASFLMEGEDLGLCVLLCDGHRSRKSLLVRSILIAERIVVQVAAVTVNDVYD